MHAGEGLLEATCEGPPLHSAIHACGAAARLEHAALSISAAAFGDVEPIKIAKGRLPAAEGDASAVRQNRSTVCGSAAVQVNCAVSRTLSVGGIWAQRNSPQADSSAAPFEFDSGVLLCTCLLHAFRLAHYLFQEPVCLKDVSKLLCESSCSVP